MFNKILFPTDGSDLSAKAAITVIDLARKHGGKIVTISVLQPFPFAAVGDTGVAIPDVGMYESRMLDLTRDNVSKVAAAAAAAGIPCETVTSTSTSPYEAIVETAEKHGCDVIVLASHGRKGLNKLFLGSETQKVLAHTKLPVLVLR
jgi:nucleotide-binding universal stress UspA family protein